MKILVAEDDMISRKLLTTILEQMGHRVEAYEDGVAAWAAFEKEPTPIMVVDWLMPNMDGLALTRKIRARNTDDYTYIILLTANAQTEENYHAAMSAGVDDFLEKPLDRDRLWSRLRVAERILSFTKRIGRLEAILPICSYCKKIREGKEYWRQVEEYLAEQTGTTFSHSICPDCYEKVVKPQIKKMKEE
jgi:DNA-binding response OmpR family regulator